MDSDEKKNKKERKEKKPRRVLRWTIVAVLGGVFLTLMALTHMVRGTRIARPDGATYTTAVRRMAFGSFRVHSQADMNDLGAIAYRVVEYAELKPGPFYVHFLPTLDRREKLHHLLHSPFTGLTNIYTDIWLNSCTTYGVKETTTSLSDANVFPADKLSILIILIDRLKREKSALGEHLGAYVEVLTGMKLHTVQGRASCYLLLVRQCARNRELTQFVQRQLKKRNFKLLDKSEGEFWRCIAANPAYATLEDLAAGKPAGQAPSGEKRVDCTNAFMSVLTDLVTGRAPTAPAAEPDADPTEEKTDIAPVKKPRETRR